MASVLWEELETLAKRHPEWILKIRGKGMMVGLVLPGQASEVKERFLAEKVLVNAASAEVIRILPPVNISIEEIDVFIDRADRVFSLMGRPSGGGK